MKKFTRNRIGQQKLKNWIFFSEKNKKPKNWPKKWPKPKNQKSQHPPQLNVEVWCHKVMWLQPVRVWIGETTWYTCKNVCHSCHTSLEKIVFGLKPVEHQIILYHSLLRGCLCWSHPMLPTPMCLRQALLQNTANQGAAFIFLEKIVPEVCTNHLAPIISPDDGILSWYHTTSLYWPHHILQTTLIKSCT